MVTLNYPVASGTRLAAIQVAYCNMLEPYLKNRSEILLDSCYYPFLFVVSCFLFHAVPNISVEAQIVVSKKIFLHGPTELEYEYPVFIVTLGIVVTFNYVLYQLMVSHC